MSGFSVEAYELSSSLAPKNVSCNSQHDGYMRPKSLTLLEHMNIALNQITAGCGGTQEADPWAWRLALAT